MKNKIFKIFGALSISFLMFSCQNLDRPELGDYPKDANQPGGPLKFNAFGIINLFSTGHKILFNFL